MRDAAGTPEAERPLRVFMMDLWATVPYYTAYLSRALTEAGVSVQVGAITYYLDRDCFRGRGVKLDPGLFDLVGKQDLSRTPRRLLKLIEGVVNLLALTVRFLLRPPDILHVQFLPLLRSRLPLDLWFVQFCRWRGAHTVLTVHDLLPHDTGDAHRAVYRKLYAGMDALICHSPHVRARLTDEFGVPESRIAVIAHGPFFFDLPQGDAEAARRSLGVDAGQGMVLWQGIIFPYKGVDLLLRAWASVERENDTLTLVILGTGDPALLASLQEQARAWRLQRMRFHFRFCSTEELVDAYRAAEAVVYPYRAITTSGALATGLALGVPIVASDLPVFRELLTDSENALLVSPDDTDQLANAIRRMTSDTALRLRCVDNVRKMGFGAESWHKIAEQTLEVYHAVST